MQCETIYLNVNVKHHGLILLHLIIITFLFTRHGSICYFIINESPICFNTDMREISDW